MKHNFTIALISLFLISGCSLADDAARIAAKNADEAVKAVEMNADKARKAVAAKQFSDADKYVDEASKAAQRADEAAQKLEIYHQTKPLSREEQNILQRIKEISTQAHIVNLQTQADNAVTESAYRMKLDSRVLANEDTLALLDFSKELLCLYLETYVNEDRPPNNLEYQELIAKSVLSIFIKLPKSAEIRDEIREKAKKVEAFAKKVATPPHSDAEIKVRSILLVACNAPKRIN